MRTTITIDSDVESMLRKAMRQSGESFKELINNALRAGLKTMGRRSEPFKPLTFDMGKPLVDLTKASALDAGFEDEELTARHRRRR